MTEAKTYPKGRYHVGQIGEVIRILDSKGRDVMTLPGGPERLVECANALRDVFFPENHVSATEEYVKRLETLRKDLQRRVAEMEAGGSAASGDFPWCFDMHSAPKGEVVQRETIRNGTVTTVETYKPCRIIVAGRCGVVTMSKWIPDEDRWEMFTQDSPPIAWAHWPSSPVNTGAASTGAAA
ncbi:hypothetical protein JYP52_23445 [Nitratireductor aquibiodomus]|uniref:hypothetical protein n=1 Tax=Nitratireductor aquibiodomus TaxID=204799 RepID=UPI0019D3C467|nr:hypothetical protein [Nitratireductor aquibiodomus]MBN7764096.1 hypothetical protein [Nitratireductor aquibiodomus]